MIASGTTVVSVLSDQIIFGELPPGTRLPSERTLAIKFATSRTMVREALRTIEAQGLVVVRPGLGAYVTASVVSTVPSHVQTVFSRAGATARHVAVARIMLDVESAKLAAENADPADLLSIEEALVQFEGAPTAPFRAQWDVAFHERITSAGHNPVLELVFSSIKVYLMHLTLHSALTASVKERSEPLHREMFEAIRDRDGERAAAVAAEHGRIALDLYGLDLDVPLSELRH